jgi:hypothetical protein
MDEREDPFAGWTPEQVEVGRRWVETWKHAGVALERVRRQELRALDIPAAIALLCGSSEAPPAPPRGWSGLVVQQSWFMKAARHS